MEICWSTSEIYLVREHPLDNVFVCCFKYYLSASWLHLPSPYTYLNTIYLVYDPSLPACLKASFNSFYSQVTYLEELTCISIATNLFHGFLLYSYIK